MPKHEVIIYWGEEDQAFIAKGPELPGCMADGKTHQEAIANAEVAWLEAAGQSGKPIPPPKYRPVIYEVG